MHVLDHPDSLDLVSPGALPLLHIRSVRTRPRPTLPLETLACSAFPAMRVELWGAPADRMPDCTVASHATAGCEVDALRFHLADHPALEGWREGVPEVLPPCPRGTCSLLDYAPRRAWHGAPAEMIVFRLPRGALLAWAHANGHQRFDGLRFRSGAAFADPVLANLALAMHRSLSDGRAAAPAFTAMIFESVLGTLVKTFGAVVPERHRGGLAHWQMRAVERLVAGRLDSQILLSELADLCGLSVSYFVKAFRVTAGVTPHQWLIARRVDRARDLLRLPRLPLADIAASCGFADQSHFTRMFSKVAGVSPGLWRKQMQTVARLAAPTPLPS